MRYGFHNRARFAMAANRGEAFGAPLAYVAPRYYGWHPPFLGGDDIGELSPAVQDLLRQGVTLLQIRQINKINAERLKQGLPPLSNQEMRTLAPAVNVGVDDKTRNLIIAGFAGLALLLLTLNKRGRR